MKLSIIIPAYNAEKHIGRCLDSILPQIDDRNIEVIIVNDCATDHTQEIIDQYKSNPQIKTTTLKVNVGLPSARNAGIKLAQGDYIAFIDSDDMVHKDYIQKLIRLIPFGYDIIRVNFVKILHQNLSMINYYFQPSDGSLTGPEYYEKEIEKYGENIQIYAWQYIVRRQFFQTNNLYYVEHPRVFEDIYYAANLLAHAHSIYVVPDPLIYYIHNPQSITDCPETVTRNIRALIVSKIRSYFDRTHQVPKSVSNAISQTGDGSIIYWIKNNFLKEQKTLLKS